MGGGGGGQARTDDVESQPQPAADSGPGLVRRWSLVIPELPASVVNQGHSRGGEDFTVSLLICLASEQNSRVLVFVSSLEVTRKGSVLGLFFFFCAHPPVWLVFLMAAHYASLQ